MLIGSVGMVVALSGVAWVFYTNSHKGLLMWLLHAVHRVLRDLAGVGDLGVYRGGVSVAGAVEGTECGVVFALDYECD